MIIRLKKVIILYLILSLLLRRKNILSPIIALIVLDLSPVSDTQIKNNKDKIIQTVYILLFLGLLLNKYPRTKKKKPFKYPATIGSSLKKLTILSA